MRILSPVFVHLAQPHRRQGRRRYYVVRLRSAP
jgi:hypothetical protein